MKEKVKQNNIISEEKFTEDEIIFREFATKAFITHSSANKIMKQVNSLPVPRKIDNKESIFDLLVSMWNGWGRKLAPAFAVFICAALISFYAFSKNKPTETKSISLVSITALSSEALADGKHVEGNFISQMDLSLMQPLSLNGNFEINIEGLNSANLIVEGNMRLLPVASNDKIDGININGENVNVKLNDTKNIRILVNNKDFVLQSKANKQKISKKKQKVGLLLASDTNNISKQSFNEKSSEAIVNTNKGPRLIGRIKSLPDMQIIKEPETSEDNISDQTEEYIPVNTEGDLEYESPFEKDTITLGE